jgi:SAM-dependent methyltransferase
MTDDRRRERQGEYRVRNGIPEPDVATSLAILHGTIIGRWLNRQQAWVGGDLLDLGCGNRPFAAWYRPLVASSVGLDAVAVARVDVVAMADRLPIRTGAFDTVLATQVLEHVTDADLMVAEMHRVLRPGGHALVTVPYLYPTHEEPYDYWRFTHFGLASILHRHGFDVVELDAKGGAGTMSLHYLTLAARAAAAALERRRSPNPSARPGRATRALIAYPQKAIARWLPERSGVTGIATRLSLGYMAVGRRL